MRQLAMINFWSRFNHFLFGAFYNLSFEIITSRALGPENIGNFEVAKSLIAAFERVKSLNFSIIATKLEGDEQHIFNSYFSLLILQEVIFVSIFIIYTYFWAIEDYYLITILAVGSVLSSFNNLYRCRASRELQFYKALKWLTLIKYITGGGVCLAALIYSSPIVLAVGELTFTLAQLFLLIRIFGVNYKISNDFLLHSQFLKSGIFFMIVDIAPFFDSSLFILVYRKCLWRGSRRFNGKSAVSHWGADIFVFVYVQFSFIQYCCQGWKREQRSSKVHNQLF